MPTLSDQLKRWSTGVNHEVEFWSEFIATEGRDFPGDYDRRLSANLEWDRNDSPIPKRTDKILDVGSGPLTRLAKALDGHILDITAVDPLAPYYNLVLTERRVLPPVLTQQAFAEDLTARFDLETFDFINMQNALDHSIEPLRAIEEMLLLVKIGGVIVLTHAINEAERENYAGLHQWNFDEEAGAFVIWNKDGRYIVDDIFNSVADIKTTRDGKESLRSVIVKKQPLSVSLAGRQRDRLQELLAASLDTVYTMQSDVLQNRMNANDMQQPKRWRLQWPLQRR